MGIRTRAIFIIVLINLVIILFSVCTGIIYVQRNIDISLETDLKVMANIADHFLSTHIHFLKFKARTAAQNLAEVYEKAELSQILSEQNKIYPEFSGMAVLDAYGEFIAVSGERYSNADIMSNPYIMQTFLGKETISSTYQAAGGILFYMAVPLPYSYNRILVLTLPGSYFSSLLSGFVIWKTGHIFLSDSQGYAIANPREHWVNNRFNYIQIAQTDKSFTNLSRTVTRMTRGESGTGYYSVDGIPRVCSFRPVSGSEEGWSLGVVAPLPESPIKNTDQGLLIVAFVSFLLGLIAAIIASASIKKPFEKIAMLKEEADAANKAKSTFLSIMSHEIRTPMNAILGISEIQLQRDSLDPDAKEALGKIYSSGDMLLNIINSILDLSKIEAGRFELLIDEYEVASMISDTAQLNMMRIGSRPIRFELDINENIPSYLLGDELRIKQILNNILSNAFKYTDEGSVKLSINTQDSSNEEEVILTISVSDTGQGMTEDQVSKLFDLYSQFNTKANRAKEGTGLGMSITRNLINMMSGNINIESCPGKGSVFTLSLPQGKCGAGVIGPVVAENLKQFRMSSRDFMDRISISREPMPYGSVLIVDDTEANIYVAKGLLSLYDIKTSSASSGLSAIEKIKNGEKFDIIFMDHMMPEMDGVEALQHIRFLGYKAPIIALSANAAAGQAEEFIRNGFDDFISKPIDIRHMDQILIKYIRDKKPQEVVEEARRQKKEAEEAGKIGNGIHKNTGSAQGSREKSRLLGMRITGLDIAKGIKRLGGDEKVYLDVLCSYVADVDLMLNDIESINKADAESLSEAMLKNYIIKVHGIKGTSLNMYASDIAKEAQSLEKAGNSGDFEFIKNNNSSFMINTRNLIAEIKEMLLILDSDNQKPIKDKPDEGLLLKLLNACNEYDMDGADAAVEELEKYKYQSDNDLIEWLRYGIDRMLFEDITEKLSNKFKT